MIKTHVMALIFLGTGTLLFGQTQGCDLSAVFNVLRPNATAGADDNSHESGDDTDDTSGSPDDPSGNSEIILVAQLGGGGAEHGDAEYRERSGRLKLNVELEDAVPGSSHEIRVNGVLIGTLMIGPLGEAEAEFDTNVEPEHLPWPDALTEGLNIGDVLQVGSTQGAFSAL
ncbi:MAG TPA: hypothetical protein VJZ71_16430 [Phycisphaerae bacterium]|nr:hypothetical protein [Phycisphaerae bacterium]